MPDEAARQTKNVPQGDRKATCPGKRAKARATLAERIVNAPRLIDRKKAHARVSDWLGELSSAEAKPLSALFAAKSTLAALMGSLSESSPYLWELASREPKRLLQLLEADPDEHLAALLDSARPCHRIMQRRSRGDAVVAPNEN